MVKTLGALSYLTVASGLDLSLDRLRQPATGIYLSKNRDLKCVKVISLRKLGRYPKKNKMGLCCT